MRGHWILPTRPKAAVTSRVNFASAVQLWQKIAGNETLTREETNPVKSLGFLASDSDASRIVRPPRQRLPRCLSIKLVPKFHNRAMQLTLVVFPRIFGVCCNIHGRCWSFENALRRSKHAAITLPRCVGPTDSFVRSAAKQEGGT